MNVLFQAANISLFSSIISFVIIAVVARIHFAVEGRTPLATNIVYLSAFSSLCIFIWFVLNSPRDSYVPVGLYVTSLSLFFWTFQTTRGKKFVVSFTDLIPEHLTVEGPYRFVRHPFYLSYLFYFLGNAMATTAWLPWVMLALMLCLYLLAARKEERYLAQGTYSTAYETYKRKTGMLFPRIRPL